MARRTEPLPWQSLQTEVSDTFAQARRETLNLVQWLARIANSYVEGRTPEDRVLLAFRAADAAFVTKAFDGFALELRLPTLQMQFLDDGRPTPHILDPEEHSPAEVEAYLLIELLHRGIDRSKFSKTLPYNIPDLMSGDEDDHSPQACMAGLTQLAAWFQNAAAVLDATARAAGAGKVEIVSWPQTLTLTCVSDAGPTGFGFSPGDTQSPAPFFYRNARSANGSANSNGRTILTASKLLAERDPAAAAAAFMSESK